MGRDKHADKQRMGVDMSMQPSPTTYYMPKHFSQATTSHDRDLFVLLILDNSTPIGRI